MTTTNITFISGSLNLEGQLSLPGGTGPFPGVVLCHPHPLNGGDMYNNVIEGMLEALVDREIAVLTFNFRGVGKSEGTHDRGTGEVADALAALQYLASHSSVDGNPMGIAGYSFGAGIALNATARDRDLRAVAAVACPTQSLDDPALQQISQPKLFIQGDADHFVQLDPFHSLVERLRQPTEVEVLSGANHFLRGYEYKIGSRVAQFFSQTLA